MTNQTLRKAAGRPQPKNLAKGIKIDALAASAAALDRLDPVNDESFAAVVQIAIAGAGFSAGELGRTLHYDTGTIIKWYQGVMAPPREVARHEVLEIIKAMIARRLDEWRAARDSVAGIRAMSQKGRSNVTALKWKAVDMETV